MRVIRCCRANPAHGPSCNQERHEAAACRRSAVARRSAVLHARKRMCATQVLSLNIAAFTVLIQDCKKRASALSPRSTQDVLLRRKRARLATCASLASRGPDAPRPCCTWPSHTATVRQAVVTRDARRKGDPTGPKAGFHTNVGPFARPQARRLSSPSKPQISASSPSTRSTHRPKDISKLSLVTAGDTLASTTSSYEAGRGGHPCGSCASNLRGAARHRIFTLLGEPRRSRRTGE